MNSVQFVLQDGALPLAFLFVPSPSGIKASFMDLQGGSLNIVTRQLYSACCPKTPFPEEESKEDSRPFQLSRAYELSLCSVPRVKEL